MSVEKEIKRNLRRAVIWRIIGEPVHFLANLFLCIGRFFEALGDAVFYFEQEAVRKYELMTRVDPAYSALDRVRYGKLWEQLEIEPEDTEESSVYTEDDE